MMNSFNLNKLVRENVKHLQPYSSARDEFKDASSEDFIFLDANENPYDSGVNRYPDPQQRNLKELLAKRKNVEASQLLLGNGSDEVLDLLFRSFCEPHRDNIISLPPTYGMYGVLAEINAITHKKVILTNDFQPNVDKILSVTDKNTKMLFICSPNNPTGNSFNTEKVAKLLSKFSGLVVIDEAYIDFSEQESWIAQLDKFPNLVITQTLSKAFGMAGIRLGICISSKEIISVLNKIKPPYNVNQLSQAKAIDRITNIELMQIEANKILEQKALLISALKQIRFVKKIFDSDANFLLVRVDDAQKRYNQLIKKGIVVRNRSKQQLCENTLRFTIGIPAENDKLISTLKDLD